MRFSRTTGAEQLLRATTERRHPEINLRSAWPKMAVVLDLRSPTATCSSACTTYMMYNL